MDAKRYIGIPHQIGARGPEAVDCWGLLGMIYAREYGISLPELPGASVDPIPTINARIEEAATGPDWTEIKEPAEGCAVAMSQNKALHHVGIYTQADGGKVIHSWDGHSVVADTFRSLRLKGFKTIKFFRHRLWPT